MTYATAEASQQSGAPIELYLFIQGVNVWAYTSAPDAVVYDSYTYTPTAISRDRIKQNTDVFKNALNLKFPKSNPFAAQFMGQTPDFTTTVTVYRGHVGETDYIAYWKGRVVNAEVSGNSISIQCESIFTSIQRPGLRAKFEYTCRHALYSGLCGASAATYGINDQIVEITNSSTKFNITDCASYPDGWFTGGILLVGTYRRFIVNHVGTIITVSRPLLEAAANDYAVVYPGCDHTMTTCKNKFNNILNFGGFPWVPTKNPFGGSSIV